MSRAEENVTRAKYQKQVMQRDKSRQHGEKKCGLHLTLTKGH